MAHKYLGYVTIAFLVVQTVLGVLTYFKRKIEGHYIPAFPDRVHCACSCSSFSVDLAGLTPGALLEGAMNWLTLLLAYTTIFTGLWVMLLPWFVPHDHSFGGASISTVVCCVGVIRYYKVVFGGYVAALVIFSVFLDIATFSDLTRHVLHTSLRSPQTRCRADRSAWSSPEETSGVDDGAGAGGAGLGRPRSCGEARGHSRRPGRIPGGRTRDDALDDLKPRSDLPP